MFLDDSCIQCLATLVAACGYKVIVKVAAGKIFIYCILSTKYIRENELVAFMAARKYKLMGK